ncbi:unnamed protein product [Dovyalis caffra]|uniref:Flavin-containing monooxygenase n=1 Tax=Dovyalis caffra TaxID=77055 RepID=A0AAV1STD1_9ROSI|nr:unnamed protein product [Dovyalis caffra]
MQTSNATSLTPCHVAVIGAGAAGLVAVRELRREGHQVVVFEKDSQIGGTWLYTPRVEPEPLALDPTRPIVHTSLYKSLRTNLPRESMGFMDYPFVTRAGKGSDPRRFPGHTEVLKYLQDFAREFGIEEMVRFECEVVSVEMVDNGKWKLKSKKKRLEDDDFFLDEVFDAVVVCNGHFTEPRIAEIPGINLWPGKQIHSHNYRTPDLFRDKVVILIGSSASAIDLSLEIGGVAKEVHITSRSVANDTYEKWIECDNVWLHSMVRVPTRIESEYKKAIIRKFAETLVLGDIESVHKDGTVAFRDGYKYYFRFLKTNGMVTVDDNRVGPLYKHDMMEDVNSFYSTLEASGVPKRHTHNMGDTMRLHANPKTFRDEWEDDNLVLQAREDFSKYISKNVANGNISE